YLHVLSTAITEAQLSSRRKICLCRIVHLHNLTPRAMPSPLFRKGRFLETKARTAFRYRSAWSLTRGSHCRTIESGAPEQRSSLCAARRSVLLRRLYIL